MKTDNELKELVAKMLPKRLWMSDEPALYWIPEEEEKLTEDWLNGILIDVRDTEMLAICQMIASGMNASDRGDYLDTLHRKWANSQSKLSFIGWLETECTWQMKIECAAQVKEIK